MDRNIQAAADLSADATVGDDDSVAERDRAAVLFHAFRQTPPRAGLRTSTSKLSIMLGTQKSRRGKPRRLFDSTRFLDSKPSSLETFIVMRRYPAFAGLAATYSAKS